MAMCSSSVCINGHILYSCKKKIIIWKVQAVQKHWPSIARENKSERDGNRIQRSFCLTGSCGSTANSSGVDEEHTQNSKIDCLLDE